MQCGLLWCCQNSELHSQGSGLCRKKQHSSHHMWVERKCSRDWLSLWHPGPLSFGKSFTGSLEASWEHVLSPGFSLEDSVAKWKSSARFLLSPLSFVLSGRQESQRWGAVVLLLKGNSGIQASHWKYCSLFPECSQGVVVLSGVERPSPSRVVPSTATSCHSGKFQRKAGYEDEGGR